MNQKEHHTELRFDKLFGPCFAPSPNVAALHVLVDDGSSYILPYAHLLYSRTDPNPALEQDPEAPPQKLLIRFALIEVTVLGSGFKRIETAIQRFELDFLKSAPMRYAAMYPTHVAAIAIHFLEVSHERNQ